MAGARQGSSDRRHRASALKLCLTIAFQYPMRDEESKHLLGEDRLGACVRMRVYRQDREVGIGLVAEPGEGIDHAAAPALYLRTELRRLANEPAIVLQDHEAQPLVVIGGVASQIVE